MIEGAFRFMQHDHFFTESSLGGTEMKDRFRFAAPLPILGRLAEVLILRRYMADLLRSRNLILKQVAESDRWQEFLWYQLEGLSLRYGRAPVRRRSTARHGTARHGTARHGTARHGTARHGTARHGTD